MNCVEVPAVHAVAVGYSSVEPLWSQGREFLTFTATTRGPGWVE
jgi:hypothetical protein